MFSLKSMSGLDFGKYDSPTMEGVIKGTKVSTIGEYIDPEYHDKFDNLEQQILVVTYEFDGSERDWFCSIPKMTGYNKSNLKAFRAKNKQLPNDPSEWVGQVVELTLDGKGYLTVAL